MLARLHHNTTLRSLELGDNPLGAGVSGLLAKRHLHAAAARTAEAAAASAVTTQVCSTSPHQGEKGLGS
jgi:hypothetical protein